jgi:small-conductance mechanosensitive channel
MPIWRRFFVLAAGLAAALAAVQPGHAQQEPAETPAAAATAEAPPAEPKQVEDKVVTAFAEAIETWTAEISTQEQAIADQTATDDELKAIPDLLEALREAIREQKALLKPKLQDTRERLAKLGPVPAEGAPQESPEIAAQRKRLEAEVATIDGKLKQADKSCRLDIAVGVDYGTDVELLRSTLLGVAHAHRSVLKSPPAVVHFASFGDSALEFELRVFLRDVRDRITSSSELHFAILKALGDAGISIPFPQRDIHIKSADGKLPEDREGDAGGRKAAKSRKSSRA